MVCNEKQKWSLTHSLKPINGITAKINKWFNQNNCCWLNKQRWQPNKPWKTTNYFFQAAVIKQWEQLSMIGTRQQHHLCRYLFDRSEGAPALLHDMPFQNQSRVWFSDLMHRKPHLWKAKTLRETSSPTALNHTLLSGWYWKCSLLYTSTDYSEDTEVFVIDGVREHCTLHSFLVDHPEEIMGFMPLKQHTVRMPTNRKTTVDICSRTGPKYNFKVLLLIKCTLYFHFNYYYSNIALLTTLHSLYN